MQKYWHLYFLNGCIKEMVVTPRNLAGINMSTILGALGAPHPENFGQKTCSSENMEHSEVFARKLERLTRKLRQNGKCKI